MSLLVGLLLTAGACTDATEPDRVAAGTATPSPSDAEPSRTPTERPAPSPSEGSPDATRPCGGPLLATLVATVDGQLDAIADDDWATALGFASVQFREATDVAAFEQVIERDFPVVAEATARDVGGCRVGGEEATLGVVVEDPDGNQQALLYLFQHDPGGWAIAGAVPAGPGGGPGVVGPGADDTITA